MREVRVVREGISDEIKEFRVAQSDQCIAQKRE